MSTGETVHTSATGGQKAGNDERYDLIPAEPLRRLAIHAGTRGFGGRPGSYARMMDHAWRFWAGEEVDAATDWPHLIAAAWEAFRLVDPKAPHGVWHGDYGQSRYDRIPPDALRQLAKHFGVGAKKYADDNWTRGYDWRLTFAAANRHAEQWRAGESHDPETGSHHLIAFAWHMLVLDEFTRINLGGDTRYCTKVRKWLDAERAWRNRRNSNGGQRLGDIRVYNVDELYRQLAAAAKPARQPRVVDALGDNERDAEWTGHLGSYRWNSEHCYWERFPARRGGWLRTVCYGRDYGPYTEVLPLSPRVVDTLGDTERDAHAWRDREGDEWRWVAWTPTPIGDHPGHWEFRINRPGRDWTALGQGVDPGAIWGPFTEVLA